MADFAELLGQARLPERTVSVCLRGDLVAELEELDRQFDEAEQAPAGDGRLTSGAARRRIAEQAAELREQMQQSTVALRLRALARRSWDALVKAHPPLEGNQEHAALGYNSDTFFEALVRASIIDPVITAEQWNQVLDVLTARQWRTIVGAAQALNVRDVDVPFSRAASQLTQGSEPE
ncbi:hypothetical protein ABZS66_19250 [Dactylosporangium sp. NPDC005572]|uniref:hypothetical protein n=1 Tax=Dactylosporangium sp. NPDC005572 TaxID=3156889 RepID=UPI0033BED821